LARWFGIERVQETARENGKTWRASEGNAERAVGKEEGGKERRQVMAV
jgi:hypothetical protein